MKKEWKNNKIMDWLRGTSSFVKLLVFVIPFFCVGLVTPFREYFSDAFPHKFFDCLTWFFLCDLIFWWAYLFISFQIHWGKPKQNRIANRCTVIILAIFLFLVGGILLFAK